MGTELSAARRNALLEEARLQMDALRRLGNWMRAAASLAVTGVLAAWWGLALGAGPARGVFGILLAAVAGPAAGIIWYGRNRGRRNVRHILAEAKAGQPGGKGNRA